MSELLTSREIPARTPLESLRRIIRQRRLAAGNRGVRGGQPVVCFTEARPDELAHLRVFRPHRGRWDFEPFGIAIDREWLVRRGTSPVLYGDDQLWSELEPGQRPFFQVRTSRRGRVIDWTIEREWRHVGDLLLDELPVEKAWVFVPTLEAAQAVAEISPWPIHVLPEEPQ